MLETWNDTCKIVRYEEGHLLLVNIQECAENAKNIGNPVIETDPKNISKLENIREFQEFQEHETHFGGSALPSTTMV